MSSGSSDPMKQGIIYGQTLYSLSLLIFKARKHSGGLSCWPRFKATKEA